LGSHLHFPNCTIVAATDDRATERASRLVRFEKTLSSIVTSFPIEKVSSRVGTKTITMLMKLTIESPAERGLTTKDDGDAILVKREPRAPPAPPADPKRVVIVRRDSTIVPIYDRFAEGFATEDLRAARTMLDGPLSWRRARDDGKTRQGRLLFPATASSRVSRWRVCGRCTLCAKCRDRNVVG